MRTLLIDHAALKVLREKAEANPVHMPTMMKQIKSAEGKRRHMAQMTEQTLEIPVGCMVTFSIEHGHPGGTARHMSISVSGEGHLPNPVAIWVFATELGFTGSLTDCYVYKEDLEGHVGTAVNVVQIMETLH